MLCRSLFLLFLLAIVLSVLLRYTNSDYLFVIFKFFLSPKKTPTRCIVHAITMTTRCIMSEALVDGIILIEMGEEIFEEEFGFKCFRSSITDEIYLTWILPKNAEEKTF